MSRSGRNEKAAEYFRRAPGYSAEAIEDLKTLLAKARDEYPEAASELEVVLAALAPAHKFALPAGGRLFDETPATMLSDCRLPFPVTAFEFMCTGAVDREIVLAIQSQEDGRTLIQPIFHMSTGWVPAAFKAHFRRDHVETRPWSTFDPNDPAFVDVDPNNRGKFLVAGIGYAPFGELPFVFGGVKAGTTEFIRQAYNETFEALHATFQACAALSCTNVTTEVIRPNREAHAIKPASTLFDYHVLVLKPGASHDPSTPGDGTHASPRTHLRRGHIRRHPTAGRIWVNSCVVNPGAIGSVNKDYAVERQ